MRPSLAILAFTALVLAPTALALPLAALDQAAAEEFPPREREVEQLQRTAEEMAGIAPPQAPMQPILAPVNEAGWGPGIALGALAVVGLAGLAGFAFFHGGARFVTPAEVLQNDVRQGIYAYLKTSVGANLKQLTDDLHLTTTNAIWHLRKLEEAGLIHSKRFNGYKVFYPAEGGVEARRLSLGKTALANANAQEVFEHVVAHPGTHQREIARALGVNHGTVRWHLKKLMDAELIVETRKGKASSYEPTAMGLQALREVTAVKLVPAPVAPAFTAA